MSFALVVGLVLTSSAKAADPDLAAYWKFDDGFGTTAFDSSGNGNDGIFVGDPQWVDGKLGGALEFNGDDYLNCGNGPSLQIQDEITIAFWFQVEAFSNSWEAFIAKSDSAYRISRGGETGNATHLGISGTSVGNFNGTATVTGGDWHHMAAVYDGTNARIYIDGVLDTEVAATGQINLSSSDLYIGENSGATGRFLHGLLDEVRIYSRALTDEEILGVMAGAGAEYPFASRPNPADGALYADTWASMSWKTGDFAASHDVYFGETFDDVNDGTGDTFRGNHELPYFVVGFPGYPYPDGLVNGKTYYWRIDEVNDTEPNSPWKGKVWSFSIPSKKAYDSSPSDGVKFIDTEVTLSWTAGFEAKLHYVYFGEDYDTVANATDGLSQVFTEYSPGTLEFNKTYYWRVDEFEGPDTHTGDVWSFTTTIEGLGEVVMERWENIPGTDIPALTSSWKYPNNPDVTERLTTFSSDQDFDNYGGRIHGWLYAPGTGDYTFWLCADNNGELWLSTDDDSTNVRLIAQESNWSTLNTWGTGEQQSDPIPLVAGQKYYIMALWKEEDGGDHCQVAWQGPGVPTCVIIPGGNLSPYEPLNAFGAKPSNNATGVTQTPIIEWKAGLQAASHELFFGTDEEAVRNATKASPEYKGAKALGDESYDPGKLPWESTFYWRIDEVNSINPDSPWVGNVWNFTTADFLIIDDFEGYDASDNQIWYSWHDGLGYGVPGVDPYFAGNGTGAAVGDETTASYTEETIVHGGSQSMPISYDNNKQGFSKYSEVELTLTEQRDWTEEGVANLSLWFRGYPASVGSFTEGPAGTYTMTASGTDIWDNADEFHYAYKTLTGVGSIVAKVESVDETNNWAKAGVMIRESLEPGSVHATMVVTPAQGVSFQRRIIADAVSTSANSTTGDEVAPYWIKIERDIAGNFTAYSSTDGSTWTMQGTPENIQMGANVYIGLAVTSHDVALTCQAVFTNVTTTGTVSPQWVNQDIGIASNDAEPLYVTVSNSAGAPAVVVHDDPAAATIDTWTEWIIPLQAFADQGIVLTNVDRIAIGLGTQGNTTIPGGSGKIFIDDVRLYQPAPEPEPQP